MTRVNLGMDERVLDIHIHGYSSLNSNVGDWLNTHYFGMWHIHVDSHGYYLLFEHAEHAARFSLTWL